LKLGSPYRQALGYQDSESAKAAPTRALRSETMHMEPFDRIGLQSNHRYNDTGILAENYRIISVIV